MTTPTSWPDLVIFDCDGVLIDSEPLSARALVASLGACGLSMTMEDTRRYLGRSQASMLADIEERFTRKLPSDFVETLRQNQRELFDRDLQAIEGIGTLLDTLAYQAIRVCVASSSGPDRLQHTLGLTGLWDRFAPHVFSTVQVQNGKPAPDLFLFAAAQMQIPPSRCVVMEDSLAGVQAAKAAAMTVYGFTGGSHCTPDHADKLRQQGADAVFGRMEEVAGVFGRRTVMPSVKARKA